MAAHEEGIIREAGEACRLARLHGCTIEVHIRRWPFRQTDVVIRPDGALSVAVDGLDADTKVIPQTTPVE
jgi:hypothetical protein